MVLAVQESSELVRKTLDLATFLGELRVSLSGWILHKHTRQTRGKVIHEEWQCVQRESIVFHFDSRELDCRPSWKHLSVPLPKKKAAINIYARGDD